MNRVGEIPRIQSPFSLNISHEFTAEIQNKSLGGELWENEAKNGEINSFYWNLISF